MGDLDPWWLLAVPVLFGLGWFAARYDIQHWVSESRTMPEAYFQGLNFLLNDQHDKAIDRFIEVVKLDPETIELHFALGSLFRRRGEADRAIRIHQNLLDRADLPSPSREQALFELAQDFLKAGLLDRAETGFVALKQGRYRADALRSLLRILQMEREWFRAIDVAQELERELGEAHGSERAQMHCELVQAAREAGNLDLAQQHVDLARLADPTAVRPAIELAELRRAKGDASGAIDAWQQVLALSPAHAGLMSAQALQAYQQAGRLDEGIDWLRALLARTHSLDALSTLFEAEMARQGVQAAYTLVRAELAGSPSLFGLDRLLQAQIALAPPERRGDLEILKTLIHEHTERLSRYACGACGFKAKRHYWQCPGCTAWNTYAPQRLEQLTE